jgi:hypothetical protein
MRMKMVRWLALAGVAVLGACSFGADVPVAEKATDEFHAQLNAGQFDAIYQNGSADLKGAAEQADMVALLGAIHRKLGAFKGGKTANWNDSVTTAGHVITLSYDAVYEQGKASEEFVYRIDSGRAALVGYHINSNQLLLR